MMRWFLLGLFSVMVRSLYPQSLVIAGCELQSQVKLAEQLIEKTREKNWNRTTWEALCRENGFVAVGSENVVYLIPIYYTPDFVEYSLIPFIDHVAQLQLSAVVLDTLPKPMQPVALALTARLPNRLLMGVSSAETAEKNLRSGAIALGLSAGWLFDGVSAEDATESGRVFVDLKRLQRNPTKILETFPLGQLTSTSTETTTLERWQFVFSHPLSLARRVEHLKAYLEWVLALHQQLRSHWEATKQRAQAILHPNEISLQPAGVYSLSEIANILDGVGRIIPLSDKTPEQLIYREWRVWITVIQKDSAGTGTREVMISLEELMGLAP
ncbi:MAG: hypothetical protein WHS44_05190 [Fimbriimonadales bacterium]